MKALKEIFDSYIGDFIEKGGKPAFVGEVREWGGRKFKKQTKGWEEISDKTTKEEDKSNKDEFESKDEYNIYNYTDDWYLKLNRNLTNGVNDEREDKLNSSLNKLPDFKGKVWREMGAIKELDQHSSDYLKGDLIKFDAFISTTKQQNGLSKFGSDILFEIDSKTGKDVSMFSLMPEEKEVLFKSKSVFEVKSKKEIKLKGANKLIKIVIKLKEI